MAATTTITVRIPEATKAKLEKIAEASERSLSYLAADAIEAYVKIELPIIESILRGLEDIEAGRVVPHEQVVAETKAIIDAAIARKAVGKKAVNE